MRYNIKGIPLLPPWQRLEKSPAKLGCNSPCIPDTPGLKSASHIGITLPLVLQFLAISTLVRSKMSSSTKRKIFFDEILRVLHVFVCASGMPGYLLSALITDTSARRFIRIRGFAIFIVILLAIGFGYGTFDKISLGAYYILAQVFFNFGPNAKTLVVPAEYFPTRYRSTCCGWCAAPKKLGAVIIQVLSQPLLTTGVRARCKGEGAVRFWGM